MNARNVNRFVSVWSVVALTLFGVLLYAKSTTMSYAGRVCNDEELGELYAFACGEAGRPTGPPCSVPAGAAGCAEEADGRCVEAGRACGACTGPNDFVCVKVPNQPSSKCSDDDPGECCDGQLICQNATDSSGDQFCDCVAGSNPTREALFRVIKKTEAAGCCDELPAGTGPPPPECTDIHPHSGATGSEPGIDP